MISALNTMLFLITIFLPRLQASIDSVSLSLILIALWQIG